MKNIFHEKPKENDTVRLVPGLFLFFQRALFEVKASDQQLTFNIFW